MPSKAELQSKLDRPPVQWQTMNDQMSVPERDALVNDLDDLIQRATMLREYIRQQPGTGHDHAVKLANRKLTSVRKLLGFSYPASGCFTF